MGYICEKELMNIYHSLEPRFRKQGLESEVALIRDYMLKMKISENGIPMGKLIVDYSPKRQTYGFRRDSDLPEEQFNRILGVFGKNVSSNSIEESDIIASATKSNSKKTTSIKVESVIDKYPKDIAEIRYHAYVDGSFIDGSVGYGAVILDNGISVAEISGSLDDPEAVNSRQVGGEIQAVIEVLKWCENNNVNKIAIFYDFQNIEKWAIGEYRTNTPMTQAYKKYIDECDVSIKWVKVESHTGIELNDRADVLAKNGAKRTKEL